ncbi:hypothetical protein D3218_18995 [Aureimonas flava]|uniref:Uncharacterized protein n=1 Tax=Aureimonas flava TaxID=2320271 RepID=A0A3A1WHF9_9HYPH|nr:hypothetical protein [Aureimonas flava]RIX97303.1 hypothetical protein D3218_18995 [Aureimonas flava]
MESASAAHNPLRGSPRPATLTQHAFAFLVVGLFSGAVIASFGLWLVLLAVHWPIATWIACMFGGPPALAAFATARLARNDRQWAWPAPILVGSVASVLWLHVVGLVDLSVARNLELTLIWILVTAGGGTLLALSIAPKIQRPGRALLVSSFVLTVVNGLCFAWSRA